ncbi:MAG: response regulator [Candidatus Scalindua rubra]|uniref:Sigma 54 response regulatory protein n=1 Tax=Candidatus Scalindua brodae TaxID=237368 RepID=A0A0B0EH70_9BACT|nr:MAG: sigma 54 response regulatory protein [Candidatus Scalindua brodae]MBZ0109210.1 response regulator [Candidatus Scalindua rubra]
MDEKILFVDDDSNILAAHRRQFHKKFNVVTVDSGNKGIDVLKGPEPVAVVVSDYRMPEMDGVQFLSTVRQITPDTVRILLTGQADMQASIDAINEGNIFRFLSKPCSMEVLMKTLDAAIGQYRLITAERELLDKTLRGSIRVVSEILSMVSPVAFSCSSRISSLAKKLATRLKVENMWEVELATMLSQIGCVTIPGETLERKYQGKHLSIDENKMFMDHPNIGKNLLIKIPRLKGIAEAIAYQEKQFDGGGTPLGDRNGTDIPLISRILKVVLDFDLMVTRGETKSQAIAKMRSHMQWYDPDVFKELESEIINKEEGFVEQKIMLKELMPGMVLAEDVKTEKGMLLLQKGHEITDTLRTRILNIGSVNPIIEPITIVMEL